MTDDEKVIAECLRAAVEGPFFPDWEFHTLLGLHRQEVTQVLASWPRADDLATQQLAVNSALNNLLGYPLKQPSAWAQYISVPRDQLEAVYTRWKAARRRTT